MAILETTQHLETVLRASVQHPSPIEAWTYPVISEFLLEHKVPNNRFVLYPQISLRWRPGRRDRRAEVPDFALVDVGLRAPNCKVRVGAEAKRCINIMRSLPAPETLEVNEEVKEAFKRLFFQGEDQAKAAFKNKATYSNTIPYLLFIGPYWTHVEYGSFNEAQLTVRTLKPSSSSDWLESQRSARRLAGDPPRRPLFLLGTTTSAAELEKIIAATDGEAEAFRNEGL